MVGLLNLRQVIRNRGLHFRLLVFATSLSRGLSELRWPEERALEHRALFSGGGRRFWRLAARGYRVGAGHDSLGELSFQKES